MKTITRYLNVVIKVTGAIVTTPVTWLVAGSVFGDVNPALLRNIVQICSVLLVEGVFLASWTALSDKSANIEVKARHALTAVVMYSGLLVLAIVHGESWAGWVFRLALGAALLGDCYEAGIVTILKQNIKIDADAAQSPKVKRVVRKLQQSDLIHQAKLGSELNQKLAQAEHDAMLSVHLERVKVQQRDEMRQVKAQQTVAAQDALNPEGFPYPIKHAQKIRARKQRLSKRQAIQMVGQILSDEPDAKLNDVAARIGRSRQTTSYYIRQLESNQSDVPEIVASDNGRDRSLDALLKG